MFEKKKNIFRKKRSLKLSLNNMILGFVACFSVMSISMKLILKNNQDLVESLYSNGLNRITREIISSISGIVSISIGEILLITFVLIGIVQVARFIFEIIKSDQKIIILRKFLINLSLIMILIYSGFLFLWGINYDRFSFAKISNLELKEHTKEDLIEMNKILIERANALRAGLDEDENGIMNIQKGHSDVFERANIGYEKLSTQYEELSGTYGKPKGILSSKWMLYTGITGIYFPFTAEANVNTDIVDFMLPVTTTHEIAHQRGFAKEDEANYIAYLACMDHPDKDFQYSGTMLALINSMNELYRIDLDEYSRLKEQYSQGVKRDLDFQRAFWDNYKGAVEKVSDNLNNSYLKSNGQEDGVESYSRVVELLLAKYDSGDF